MPRNDILGPIDDAESPDHGDGLPWVWMWVAGFVVICLTLILGSIVLSALRHPETLPEITLDAVDAAGAKWTANHPADYDMDIDQTGVNPGKFHIEVRKGEVTAMTRNGQPTKQHLWDDWSVPGLFGIIRRDVEECMPKLNAQAEENDPSGQAPSIVPRGLFDPHDGHPTEYHRITPTGAEVRWTVTKFERR